MSLPAWHEVEHALADRGAPCGASEAHGLLCGLLALAAPSPRSTWCERALDGGEPDQALDALYAETAREIDDATFGLELLMPGDDEADLESRTAALAAWCAGFTSGAGLAGRAESSLSADAREFLGDVAHVSSAAVASEEDDEASFAEVVEYLRMGTLLVRTECAGAAAGEA